MAGGKLSGEHAQTHQRLAMITFWGGRNAIFNNEDQKVWFEKMLAKKWIVPYWDTQYGGGAFLEKRTIFLLKK